jgi:two-component system sensor histidine kinase CiaH
MWYLAIAMAISLVFSVVLYSVTTSELHRGLLHETQRIYTQFPVFQDNPSFRPGIDYQTGAHRILLRLIGFNLIVLLSAGAASYWLAKRTLEPIEEAHEQQKRFTADVSHELRTPLTALRMESEVALLNDKASKQELRATLGSNLEEISKLESLINSLLRLTRLEADELQHDFTPLQTDQLVAEAIKQIKPLAAARNLKIKHEGQGSTVRGDHDSLIQLLVILLDNAVKYSNPDSTITLSSKVADDSVRLSIKDEGVGIERQALEHVFDRFYRADNSRQKASQSGFGLGLSIARMIADVHQGSIMLSSQVDKGTTATISLPAAN